MFVVHLHNGYRFFVIDMRAAVGILVIPVIVLDFDIFVARRFFDIRLLPALIRMPAVDVF